MYRYSAYGLRIESEEPLPFCADEAEGSEGSATTIAVRRCTRDPLPPGEPFPYDAGGALYMPGMDSRGKIYVRVKGCVDFVIGDNSIDILGEPDPVAATDLAARLALLFVIQLRSMLSFHGSAAARTGETIALFGDKGAGKSTTALGLSHRGWKFLSDDIVVVEPDGCIPAGSGRARLNADSYGLLMGERSVDDAPKDRDGKLTADAMTHATRSPLAAAFILRIADGDKVTINELKGFSKLAAILPHMHSPAGIASPSERMRMAAEAFDSVPLFVVERPGRRFALDETLDAIETALEAALLTGHCKEES